MRIETRRLGRVRLGGIRLGGIGDGIIVLGSNAIVKMVSEEAGWYGIWGHEVKFRGYEPSKPFDRIDERKKTTLDTFNDSLRCLPSKAAATLLLRFCVASNALAVAAAEGGLLVLIVQLTFFKAIEIRPVSQRLEDIDDIDGRLVELHSKI